MLKSSRAAYTPVDVREADLSPMSTSSVSDSGLEEVRLVDVDATDAELTTTKDAEDASAAVKQTGVAWSRVIAYCMLAVVGGYWLSVASEPPSNRNCAAVATSGAAALTTNVTTDAATFLIQQAPGTGQANGDVGGKGNGKSKATVSDGVCPVDAAAFQHAIDELVNGDCRLFNVTIDRGVKLGTGHLKSAYAARSLVATPEGEMSCK
jgi:hypothetical protein